MVADPTPVASIHTTVVTPYLPPNPINHEAAETAGMTRILVKEEVVTLNSVGLFADKVKVKTVSKETFRLCNELVTNMVTLDMNQICNAIKFIYNDA